MNDADTQTSHPKDTNRRALLILIFANLFWVFLVMWSTWGIGAVMILGVVLNHLITRYEVALHQQAPGGGGQDWRG